jgi:hypothetical protein
MAKELSVDYKKLLKLSNQDRINMAGTSLGQEIMTRLTPSQYAALFPSYFRNQMQGITGPSASLSGAMSGATSTGGGGGGSSYSPPSSAPTETALKPEPNKFEWAKKIEKDTGITMPEAETAYSNTKGSPLSKQRQSLAGNLTREQKIHMYATAMSENSTAKGRQAVLEQAYNRVTAYGKKDIVGTATGFKMGEGNYYEPLRSWRPGWRNYQTHKRALEDDPALFDEMDKLHENVISGSNVAEYGTQNSSGAWGRNSIEKEKQTLISEIDGEYNSRKDREPRERNWAATTKAEQDAWELAQAQEAAKADPTAIIPQDPTQTGQIQPVQNDPGSLKPVAQPFVLPENADPNVKSYFDSLAPNQRKVFKQMVDKAGIDNINATAKQHAARAIVDVARGTASPNGKSVDLAMTMLGANEDKDKAVLKEYFKKGNQEFKDTGVVDPSDVAWCGAFVQSSLEQSGIRSIGRTGLYASSFLNYGEQVEDKTTVQKGDILPYRVNRRNGAPIRAGAEGGHVGLATGRTRMNGKNLEIEMLSGNSSDAVRTTWEPANKLDVRRPRIEDYYDQDAARAAMSVNPQADPATTGNVAPSTDAGSMQPVVAPVENVKVPASAPPTPAPLPTPMSETGSAVPSPDSPHGRMSQEQLYARFSEDEKSALKATDTSKDKMAGIRYWQEKAAKYDSGQNAAPVQSAPQAPAKPQEAPKEVEKPADTNTPAMKTGGRVRASGEDFSIVDNESQRKLGDVNRGENINFKDTGHVQVTPEHRVDPRELEDKRATRQDNAEAQAKARTLSQETHAQVNQMLNQPQSSNFPQTEQWGHRSTPASFHRAVEASKGRKNSGSFAGSRFGEEQLSNLS